MYNNGPIPRLNMSNTRTVRYCRMEEKKDEAKEEEVELLGVTREGTREVPRRHVCMGLHARTCRRGTSDVL